jgi:hypothetical protein
LIIIITLELNIAMKRFDELYQKLLETMTAGGAGSVLNPDDNKEYAKGDNRIPFIFGKKKKYQKRKLRNTL